MAKKTTKKQIKEIKEKPTKKIKEIISNKGEDMVKNPQTTDIEIEEKPPQKIDLEIPKKEEENTEIVSEKPEPTISEEELTRVLKIPMQEAQTEETTNPVKEALFSSPESPEPEFEEEEEEEDLNEKYFGDSSDDMSDDDIDGVFFEDEELMSEMAVEIIDLGMTTMAQAIAQDFDNAKKYSVSDYKKNKIKKPLRLLLKKRGVKVSPEIMFGITLLVVYAPMMVMAVQERKAKANVKKQNDVAEEIPEHIPMVDAEQIRNQQTQTPPPPPPPPIKKKGGRPKGSKDKKPRKTEGYKGNSNSK